MNLNWAVLDATLLLPPLLTGMLVLATHVPLGQRVLARGIIFLDLAIAQLAVLGVIVAHALGWETQGWQTQLVATAAALIGAAGLAGCERRWPQTQEALIGSTFIVAASLAVLMLSGDAHSGEQLNELLAGQILWVGTPQVVYLALLSAGLLALWAVLRERVGRMGFYLIFAVAITASVQLIGVYLVFASLILPALATRGRTGIAAIVTGVILGTIAYAIGLIVSALTDLPGGPSIVLALAGVALLAGNIRLASARLIRLRAIIGT